MKKRNLKFALLLKDGRPVRSLGELKAHYDIEKVISYYDNGQLERWLEQNDYMEQLKKVQQLRKEIENKLKDTLDNILLEEENEVAKNEETVKNEEIVKKVETKKNQIISESKEKIKLNKKQEFLQEKTKMVENELPEIDLKHKYNKDSDFFEDEKIHEVPGEVSKIETNKLNEVSLKGLENNEESKKNVIQNSKEIGKNDLKKLDLKIKEHVGETKENKLNNIGESNTFHINSKSIGSLNSNSLTGNNKPFHGLGSTETLFANSKENLNSSGLNKIKYSETDIMINREDLLKPKGGGILTGLKNKKNLNNNIDLQNNVRINSTLNSEFKTINKEVGESSINTDTIQQLKTKNSVEEKEFDITEEALKDPEFERMSKIITDPKSLKMLKEFYLKNKINKKNEQVVEEKLPQKVKEDIPRNIDCKSILQDEHQYNNDELNVINKDVKFAKFTVSSQEDYEKIIKCRESSSTHLHIDVAFSGLEVKRDFENIQYIGVNNPTIFLETGSYFDAIKKDISFQNLKISAKKEVAFVCNDMEGCSIDRSKIKKGIQDLITKYPGIIVKEQKYVFVKEEDIEEKSENKGKSIEAVIDKLFSYGNKELEVLATARYEGLAIYTNVIMGMVDMAFFKDRQGDIHNISKIFSNMDNIDIFRKSPDIGIKFVALLKQGDLSIIEKMKDKKYKSSQEALEEIFVGNDAEKYLPYVMLMPVKILKGEEELSRLDQIKLIEIMNLDTGIPYISRRFSGNKKQVKEKVYEFIAKVSSFKELDGITFNGVIIECTNEEIKSFEDIPVEAIYVFKNELYDTKITNIRFMLDRHKKMAAYIDVDDIVTLDGVIRVIKFEDADRFKKLRFNVGDNVTVSVNKNKISINKDIRGKISKGIQIPLICPCCGENLSFKESGTFGICENNKCDGAIISAIYTQLIEMKLYDANIDRIAHAYSKGFIRNIYDLASLPIQNLSKILNVSMEEIEEIQKMIKEIV